MEVFAGIYKLNALTSPTTAPKFGSQYRSPLQIAILKLNYTTYKIVQPRSSHVDIDDYLINNKGVLKLIKKRN